MDNLFILIVFSLFNCFTVKVKFFFFVNFVYFGKTFSLELNKKFNKKKYNKKQVFPVMFDTVDDFFVI